MSATVKRGRLSHQSCSANLSGSDLLIRHTCPHGRHSHVKLDKRARVLSFCQYGVSLPLSLFLFLSQFSAHHRDENNDASHRTSEFTAAPVRAVGGTKMPRRGWCGEEDGGQRDRRVDEKRP